MDDNRKQAALALQPDLIEIVTDLAANAQIVNQDMAILRQSLLVQADMAVRIDVNDREDMIALGDKLSCQRAGTVRQIQQDPLVVPLSLRLCSASVNCENRRWYAASFSRSVVVS